MERNGKKGKEEEGREREREEALGKKRGEIYQNVSGIPAENDWRYLKRNKARESKSVEISLTFSLALPDGNTIIFILLLSSRFK